MPSKQAFFSQSAPIAIAHRGGAGLYRLDRFRDENTLKVFSTAINLGYQYLELDVTNTKDGKVIVLHVTADKFEAMLHKPSAPDSKKIQEFNYDDLKRILNRDIPTLETVLKSFPKTKFFIDAKTDEVVEPLSEIVSKTNSVDRVYLNSFFFERVIRLQQLLGHEINCGIIIGRHPRLLNSRMRALYEGEYFNKGLSAVTIPRRFLSEKITGFIHDHGLKVLVWAPNTEEQIQNAIKLKVDGIIADNVELLMGILTNRNTNKVSGSEIRS